MMMLLRRGILPSPKTAKNVADGDTTAAASDLEDMAGHGSIPFITRKLSSTYVDFGVGLQRECQQLRLFLVISLNGRAILRAYAESQFLRRRRDTRDGLEARLEVRYAP